MSKEIELVVGIVVYNTEIEKLQKTLASVRLSDSDPVVVVLCNSSVPEFKGRVRDLCDSQRAIFIESVNKGFGAGHNEIFNRFYPEWYVCCNPDVQISPDTISTLISFSKTTLDSQIIGPRVLNLDGTIQKLSRGKLTLKNWIHTQLSRLLPNLFTSPPEKKFDYSITQSTSFVSGCFFLVKGSIFKALDGFDESFFLYYEDFDICRRAERFGRNYYVSTTYIYHEWDQAWTKSKLSLKIQLKSLALFFRKHGI